jgi:large subunit ribosomal protein L33
MREGLSLECTVCKRRNYRTTRETRDTKKLSLKKFCRQCRKRTPHTERKK